MRDWLGMSVSGGKLLPGKYWKQLLLDATRKAYYTKERLSTPFGLPNEKNLCAIYINTIHSIWESYSEIKRAGSYLSYEWINEVAQFTRVDDDTVAKCSISISNLFSIGDKDTLFLDFVIMTKRRLVSLTPSSSICGTTTSMPGAAVFRAPITFSFTQYIEYSESKSFIEEMVKLLNKVWKEAMISSPVTQEFLSQPLVAQPLAVQSLVSQSSMSQSSMSQPLVAQPLVVQPLAVQPLDAVIRANGGLEE